MQPLLTDIKKNTLIVIASLFLSGCAWLNPLIYFQGESGDRTTLPVEVEELIEMAEYCEEAYHSANDENKLYEIRNNEFSYHVKQDRGVTILIFRGTDNVKNVWTDIDARPSKDKSLNGMYLHRVIEKSRHSICPKSCIFISSLIKTRMGIIRENYP